MFVIVTKDTVFQSASRIKAKDIKPGTELICMRVDFENKTANIATTCRVSDVQTVKCDVIQFDDCGVYSKSKTLNEKFEAVDIDDAVYRLMYGKPVKANKKKKKLIKSVECIQIQMEDINCIPYIFDDMLLVFSETPIKVENQEVITEVEQEPEEIESQIESVEKQKTKSNKKKSKTKKKK